jgi:hypothetical protein
MANEANIIRIKRSGTAGTPSSLKLGELAYSYLASTGNPDNNGGDRLFIGAGGVNGSGNANDILVIGGKYFTDLLDHARGTLTASSALIVDSDKKLDELLVDDLSLNGRTLKSTAELKIDTLSGIELNGTVNKISSGPYGGTSVDFASYELILRQDRGGGISLKVGADGAVVSTVTLNNDGSLTVPGTIKTLSNGDLTLSPNGSGLVSIKGNWTLPSAKTTVNGYVLTANTDGTTSWGQPSASVSLKAGTGTGDTGADATFNLINDDIEFRGDAKAITTALSVTSGGGHSHYVVTTSARLASTSVTGVASFSSSTFDVSILGDVSVKTGGISNTQLANSSFYIGTTSVSLGAASASITSLAVDISGNAATATNATTADTADKVANALTLGTNLSYATGSDYDGSAAREIDLASTLTGITSISASGGTGNVTLNNGTHNLTFDTDGDLVLPSFTLPNASGTAGQVLVWPATGVSGVLEWADVSTTLDFTADDEGTGTVDLLTDTFVISGGTNITTSASGTTLTINLDSSLTGVSIDGNAGTVTNGVYTTDTATVTNTMLANSTIYIGTTQVTLGDTSGTTTSLAVDISGNASSVTDGVYTTGSYANPTWITNIDYSILNGTVPTWNQDTTGNAATADEADKVANALTFATTGGTTANSTFDGSTAVTIDYSTIGAAAVGQTFYIGTTAITLNQATGTVTSLAVDISGKATTAGTADSVANSLTFATTGGTTANSTFNGSNAVTIDYSTIGAAPAAGSSSIVTVGTLTSGSIGTGFTAIPNSALANSKVTVGTTDISLGSSSTTLAGLTQVDVNNIRISGNTVSSTNTDGDIVFDPNGTGTINVSSAKITNLADPTSAQDAATKAYVDATRSGLDVKDSVRAATTGNITLSNTQTVDGVALAVGNRVLVKNQDTASENGIYVVASGAWTRATDADNSPAGEVTSGMFAFVEQGTVNADSGWVLTTDGTITLDTTGLTFVQFSGAGQITAGSGLSKTGNTLDVNVANGIEISGDNVQLASSVAGNGLTYTTGVLAVGGTTDRISISSDAVDISTNYVGQTSITTLGTISTGTWQASTLTYAYGGTGQTSYAKGDLLYASAANTLSKLTAGTNGQMLQLQDGLPVWADLDGGTY